MFGLKRTVTQIEVSAEVYDAIALAMIDAGATVALVDGALDMHSIGLVRGDEQERMIAHHPINQKEPTMISANRPKKNTAPGAI